jgi:hypothetical protein
VKTPAHLLAYRRELYTSRKLAQQCVDCAAGLQDDDGLRCVECEDRNRAAKKVSRNRDGRAVEKAYERKTRAARRANGLCSGCSEPAAAGKSRCEKHLELHREYTRNWARAKRAGLTRSKPNPFQAAPAPEMPYQPLDELKQKPRARILLRLSWMDWVTPLELFATLNVDMSDGSQSTERNTYDVTLQRLARMGFVERRRVGKQTPEYRIAQTGRTEVARMRAGDFTVQKRAA